MVAWEDVGGAGTARAVLECGGVFDGGIWSEGGGELVFGLALPDRRFGSDSSRLYIYNAQLSVYQSEYTLAGDIHEKSRTGGLPITLWGMMKMMKHSEGSKESFEPYQLTCGSSHRSIFGLGRGARDRGLFLGFPRDG